MTESTPFYDLGLPKHILSAVAALGYETSTPIQAESIPVLLEGGDLIAQAQTGTGKTAAFALPALANVDVSVKSPQILVITPTRELALQVASALKGYAQHIKGFHVAPIYGGQDYKTQLCALKRGVHAIVGTPGRVMDHLRRGSINVDTLKTVIIDEADEMLRMGFIEDVEWILNQIPQTHQTALFSATMPASVQKIAKNYIKNAKKIHIKSKENAIASIEQFYIPVTRDSKLEILMRFLQVEDSQATIIFSRTKTFAAELAERLQSRGYAAAALHGDMNQAMREKVIRRIKDGTLDIIVATDVAARGLDVERITHVFNYDIPFDTESYIHRIGRTGRAGRTGKALLFVGPHEKRFLKDIERAIQKPIEKLSPPSVTEMNERRSQQLAVKISGIIAKSKQLKPYQDMIEKIIHESQCDEFDVATALAYLMHQSNPLATQELSSVTLYDKEIPRKSSKRKKPAPAKFKKFKRKSKRKQAA